MATSNRDYKPVGGVARAVLYAPGDATGVVFDDGHCTAAFECEGVEVALLDDMSSFEECAASDAGAVSVVHTLTLVARRNDAEAWLTPDFAERAAHEGFVADIVLNDGRRLLGGCSETFGTEQPLCLVSLKSASHCRLSQTPTVTLTLRGEDGELASQV